MSSPVSSSSTLSFIRTNYEFVSVKKDSPHFPLIEKIFKEKLETIYGNQDFNLKRFRSGRLRTCELLLKNGIPIGLVAYLNELQTTKGLTNSFEVRNLYVLNPEENKGKGYENKLFRHIQELAQRSLAEGIHLPIPQTDVCLRSFLTEKNFSAKESGDKTIFYYRFDERSVSKETSSSSSSSSSSSFVGKKRARSEDWEIEEPARKSQKKFEGACAADDQKQKTSVKQSSAYNRKPEVREITASTSPSQYHEITLREPYLSQIRNGQKTIEGRINGGIVLNYKAGDTIRFFEGRNPLNEVICRITTITTFRGFREMLEASGFQKCLPGVRSLEEAVVIYEKIPGYADRARRSGVRAIHLELLPRH